MSQSRVVAATLFAAAGDPRRPRRVLLAVLATVCLATTAGCHAIDFYTPSLQQPLPADLAPPRELSMVSLPEYRIVPSDVLYIEPIKLPLPPTYRIKAGDALEIKVMGTQPQYPIGYRDENGPNGPFVVRPDGIVSLGAPYGKLRVSGLTVAEAEAEITRFLRRTLKNPRVTVQLISDATLKLPREYRFSMTPPMQPLDLAYLVAPDGTINLGAYGMVSVLGKTVPEAHAAIQERLAQYFDSPQITVEVVGYHGNRYYVIINGRWIGGASGYINSKEGKLSTYQAHTTTCWNCGKSIPLSSHTGEKCFYCGQNVSPNEESIERMWLMESGISAGLSPFTVVGNETVLDVLGRVNEIEPLPPVSSRTIWIARPAPGGCGREQILPVDWNAIAQGVTDTNYQILPGDRLYIEQDEVTAVTALVNKVCDPLYRLLGVTSAGVAEARDMSALGRAYNKNGASRRSRSGSF
jgi:protein involved in polysaccharide export with SLBB domain